MATNNTTKPTDNIAAETNSNTLAPNSTDEDNKTNQNSSREKEILKRLVNGTVKWFNIRSGYGFISREDNNEDIFVHHSSIVRPAELEKGFVSLIEDDEKVQFDVVAGEKGMEAANVTDANGEPVKGSQQHRNFRRFRGRGSWRGGRGGRRGMNHDDAAAAQQEQQPSPRGDGFIPQPYYSYRNFEGGRGRGRRPYRGEHFYPRGGMPPHRGMYMAGPYEYGPPMFGPPFRGRGGFFRGRGPFIMNGRGGSSFGPIIMAEEDMMMMPMGRGGGRMMGGGGRPRGGRGRYRGRGRRGGGGGDAHDDENRNGVEDAGPNSDIGEDK